MKKNVMTDTVIALKTGWVEFRRFARNLTQNFFCQFLLWKEYNNLSSNPTT